MTQATASGALSGDGRTPSLREWVRDHDESWLFVVLYLGLAVGLSVFVSLFWLVVVAGLHFLLELFRQRLYREGPKSVVLHALWEVKLDVGLVLLALTLVLYIDVVLGILGIQSAARAAAVTRAGARVGTRAAAWERNLRTFLLTVDEMARIVHAGLMLRRKRQRTRATSAGKVLAEGEPVAEVQPAAVQRAEAPAEEGPAAEPPEEEAPKERGLAEGAPAEKEALSEEDAPAEEAAPVDEAPEEESPAEGAPVDEAAEEEATADEAAEDEAPVREEAAVTSRPGPVVPRPPAWSRTWKLGDRIGLALVVVGALLMTAAPYLTPHDWSSARAALVEELRPFPGSE